MIESNIEGVTLKLQTGKTPPSKEEKYFNGDINWYTPTDLKTKLLGRSKRTITSLAYTDKKALIYPSGTVLLSCIGDIGKLGITTDDKSSSNQQITGLIPDTRKITSEYLYYWCLAHKYVFESKGTSVTVPMLNNKRLRKIKISYTESIDDQIKIANLLSQVEALIAKREESINLLDALLRSTFLDMFGDPVLNGKGWDIKALDQVSIFENGDRSSAYPSGNDLVESGILFLNTKNITKNTLDLTNKSYISKEKFDSLSKGKVEFGDILITLRGTLGSCCIYDSNQYMTAFINAQMMIIRADNQKINTIFLHHFLISKRIIKLLKQQGTGAAVPQLTSTQLKKLKIISPPIELQDKFATIVQQVEESKKRYQESLNELNELFGSLSQRAFKGELDLSGIETPVTLVVPSFTHKVDAEEHSEKVESSVYESNRPVYSEDFLWMVLSQADDDISYESIASKLEKYSFEEYPNYDRIKSDIFSLIEQKKLKQLFDEDNKSMKLVRAT